MSEGKMKGQAFVTFPNEEMALKALNDTNGLVLHEKPMIVQFARTAKPKDIV
jgi:U11/U12 small nuclear ribonucleoprotein SNRNP65